MRSITITAAILTLGLAACGSRENEEVAAETVDVTTATATPTATPTSAATTTAPRVVRANLQTADGKPAGTATATQTGETVEVAVSVLDLPAGEHGVHIHAVGVCEAPTFQSAGPHWNPTSQTHGLEGAAGQHAGDMPNLVVAANGTGTVEYTLGGGATFEGLMDADGAAFVVHAMPDDQMTDPSGNSGDRIACGVFEVVN